MNTDANYPIRVDQRLPGAGLLRRHTQLFLLIVLFFNASGSESAVAGGVVVDQDRVAAAGIIKRSGRHISLYTDDRDREDLDELIIVFDLAADQWCEHFGLKRSAVAGWHVQAFLMADQSRFAKAGLIPDDLPNFPAGYALRNDIWLYPQPGNYYTRHLLLHEGTHAFMNQFLGHFGPAWYSEGMAEWLGLHRWDPESRTLKLGYRVKDRREADYWGRVKIVRDQLAAGNGMTLDDVFSIEPTAFQKVRFYGWSWAACEFLSNHSLTKKNFAKLDRYVDMPAERFRRKVLTRLSRAQKAQLERDWNLFVHEIDYGYDVSRGSVSIAAGIADPLAAEPLAKRFRIAADRSWQSTQIPLRKGDRVSITGQGRFQVKMTHLPWLSEPGGVTIEYYNGHPLGRLMAGVLPAANRDADIQQPLISPVSVGYTSTVIADRDGVLCLRINESPASLEDNLDGLEVSVKKLK